MFIAKFQQVNSEKFIADKNGNMPFIGEVLAGKATATLMNGTMFQREGLEPNKLYLCDNTYNEEYDNMDTNVISVVSLLEYTELRTKLGKASISLYTKGTQAKEEVPAEADNAPIEA